MSNGRNRSKNLFDDIHDFLRRVPWWVGPPFVLFVWVLFRYLLPGLMGLFDATADPDAPIRAFGILATVSRNMALLLAVCVGVVWVVAIIHKWVDGRRLDKQSGIDSIRGLSWQAFELLLAEAFRRQGYGVSETGPGADGGIDLILSKGGRKTIVQAKQWKKRSVGVKVVRELNGVRSADADEGAIVVTSGRFTHDAWQFANERDVQLIDGEKLVPMIAEVQRSGRIANEKLADESKMTVAPSTPACPVCGSVMVQRVAKRGSSAGQAFWGCPAYPVCTGTRSMDM